MTTHNNKPLDLFMAPPVVYSTERELWTEAVKYFEYLYSQDSRDSEGLCGYLSEQLRDGHITFPVYDRAHVALECFRPQHLAGIHSAYWWGFDKAGHQSRATACGFLAAQAAGGDNDLSN